jgi:hypothetical protein
VISTSGSSTSTYKGSVFYDGGSRWKHSQYVF